MISVTTTNARLRDDQRLPWAASGTAEIATGMDLSETSTPPPSKDAAETVAKELVAAGFQALDLLGIGLVVTNAAGQLLGANRKAEDLLNSRDGIQLDSNGVMCAVDGGSPSLHELLHRAAAVAAVRAGSKEFWIAVPRQPGKRALTLLVRPAKRAWSETRNSSPSVRPAALVMIVDSGIPANTVEEELRQLYRLTPMETRLAMGLVEGNSLDHCCHELGIRRSTGRMHVRNLFVKTGVRRQAELVSLLLRSIGLGPRAH